MLAVAHPAAAQAPIVASVDGAFVAHEPSSDLWTIGSRGLELAIGFGADHVLSLQRLSDPVSGRTLNITPGADVSLTAGGGRTTDFDDTLTEGISLAIASYKTFRDTIAIANATLLSDQAPVDESAWEVVQEVADQGRSVVIFAFKGDDTEAPPAPRS